MTKRSIHTESALDYLTNAYMVKATRGCRDGEEVRIKRKRTKSKSNLTILKQIKNDQPNSIPGNE